MLGLNQLSLGVLKDTTAYAQKEKNKESVAFTKLNLNNIIQVDFPENQYMKEQTDKKQICLHHTVSGQGVDGDISWWLSTADRIATALIIGWDGKIYQCFSTKYWGHHLGIKASNNTALNKGCIGIEIDAWGGLIKSNNLWYPAKWDEVSKKNVPNIKAGAVKNVQEYSQGFRGYFGFEKYTDKQIESVRELLVYFNEKYGIPLTYNESMWKLSQDALVGKTGIWTHVSFRQDKSDCHPQKELTDMLKSLK